MVLVLPRIWKGILFGKFIKELRTRRRIGLREFCSEHGHDPSNWSKIERERLHPPKDERTLGAWAKELGIRPGSEDWQNFFDYADVDLGRIPPYVLKHRRLVSQLPNVFRTLSGEKLSREQLEKLIETIVDTKARSRMTIRRRLPTKKDFTRSRRKKRSVRQPVSHPLRQTLRIRIRDEATENV